MILTRGKERIRAWRLEEEEIRERPKTIIARRISQGVGTQLLVRHMVMGEEEWIRSASMEGMMEVVEEEAAMEVMEEMKEAMEEILDKMAMVEMVEEQEIWEEELI